MSVTTPTSSVPTPISSVPTPDGDVSACYSGITQDACADEPDIKSTKDACEKINKKAKKLWYDMVPSADALSPLAAANTAISTISNAFSSTNESSSKVIQSVKEQNNATQVSQLFNECIANSNASATNIINGNDPSCVIALQAGGFSSDEIRSVQENITQTAEADAKSTCSVQAMMQNIASLKTSTDQQAVLQVLQEANGLFSGNSANTDFCSSIDITNNTCTWMQQQNCCIAESNAQATNLINAGCLSTQANITQTAVANSSSTCTISASGLNSADISSYISQKADSDVSQKATGASTWALILFFVVIFVLPPLVFVLSTVLGDAGSLLKDCGTAISNSTKKSDNDNIGVVNNKIDPTKIVEPSRMRSTAAATTAATTAKTATPAGGSTSNSKAESGESTNWSTLVLFMFSLAIAAGCCIFLAINSLGYYKTTIVDPIDGMLNYPLTDCDSTALSTMGDFAENLANPFDWPNLVPDLGIGDNAYVGTRSTYRDAVNTFEANGKVMAMDFFLDRDKVPTPTASPEGVVYADPTGVDGENPVSADNPPLDLQMGTVMYINTPTYEPQTCTKIGGMNEEKFTTFTKAKGTSGSIFWKTIGIGSIVMGLIMLGVLILFIVVAAKTGNTSGKVNVVNNTYNANVTTPGGAKPTG